MRLLVEHRIIFCPAASLSSLYDNGDASFSRASFLSSVETNLMAVDPDRDYVMTIVGQLDSHLLMAAKADYRRWTDVFALAHEAFDKTAGRPGYEWLYPTDPRSGLPALERMVGLRSGLARINDLVAAGLTEMEMDEELPVLLEVCFPATKTREATRLPVDQVNARDVVNCLHRIANLPALGQLARERLWSNDILIDTLISDEASALRSWLRENAVPGMDVRDAYIATEKILPSRQHWNGWLRFGAVTSVSAVIGALITGPVGIAAGVLVGALDQQYGSPTQKKLFDPYHPDRWLSFIKRV